MNQTHRLSITIISVTQQLEQADASVYTGLAALPSIRVSQP